MHLRALIALALVLGGSALVTTTASAGNVGQRGDPVVDLVIRDCARDDDLDVDYPLRALRRAAAHAQGLGLAVHAGHGLTYQNVQPVAAIPEIEELNIGHSVVSRALFVGLADAVKELRAAMDAARRRA